MLALFAATLLQTAQCRPVTTVLDDGRREVGTVCRGADGRWTAAPVAGASSSGPVSADGSIPERYRGLWARWAETCGTTGVIRVTADQVSPGFLIFSDASAWNTWEEDGALHWRADIDDPDIGETVTFWFSFAPSPDGRTAVFAQTVEDGARSEENFVRCDAAPASPPGW